MYDVIGDAQNFDDDATRAVPRSALEWMDCTLADVSYAEVMHNNGFMKVVIEASLSSIVDLAILICVNLSFVIFQHCMVVILG